MATWMCRRRRVWAWTSTGRPSLNSGFPTLRPAVSIPNIRSSIPGYAQGMKNRPLTRREAGKLVGASLAASSAADAIPDICLLSAAEMARRIRAKQLSAREALAAHLKQIERVNPRVNAIVTLVAEKAADAAAKADEMQAHNRKLGALHGLPVAHKDLFETRGIRTTFGSLLYKDYIPAEDDIVVERIARAGAITIGKT